MGFFKNLFSKKENIGLFLVSELFHFDEDIAVLIEDIDDDAGNWRLQKSNEKLIPNVDGLYFAKGIILSAGATQPCFVGLITPERALEFVIVQTGEDTVEVLNVEDVEGDVIPTIGSKCFGNYELYYSKINPQKGIDVLKQAIENNGKLSPLCEDIGYISRDENMLKNSIDAFEASVNNNQSSEYIYHELSQLYLQLGDEVNSKKYSSLFETAKA